MTRNADDWLVTADDSWNAEVYGWSADDRSDNADDPTRNADDWLVTAEVFWNAEVYGWSAEDRSDNADDPTRNADDWLVTAEVFWNAEVYARIAEDQKTPMKVERGSLKFKLPLLLIYTKETLTKFVRVSFFLPGNVLLLRRQSLDYHRR